MLYLTSAPFKYKCDNSLHIIHPKEVNNPEVQNVISQIHDQGNRQILRIGEHIVADFRFNHFNTVVLHTVSTPNEKDYLHRLQEYKLRLKRIIRSPQHKLIVFDKAIKLLCDQILYIPHVRGLSIKEYLLGRAMETKGLGLIHLVIDTNFQPMKGDERYLDIVKELSRRYPIYLMDPKVLWMSNGKVLYGKLYKAYKSNIGVIKVPPKFHNTEDMEKDATRSLLDSDEDEYSSLLIKATNDEEPKQEDKSQPILPHKQGG